VKNIVSISIASTLILMATLFISCSKAKESNKLIQKVEKREDNDILTGNKDFKKILFCQNYPDKNGSISKGIILKRIDGELSGVVFFWDSKGDKSMNKIKRCGSVYNTGKILYLSYADYNHKGELDNFEMRGEFFNNILRLEERNDMRFENKNFIEYKSFENLEEFEQTNYSRYLSKSILKKCFENNNFNYFDIYQNINVLSENEFNAIVDNAVDNIEKSVDVESESLTGEFLNDRAYESENGEWSEIMYVYPISVTFKAGRFTIMNYEFLMNVGGGKILLTDNYFGNCDSGDCDYAGMLNPKYIETTYDGKGLKYICYEGFLEYNSRNENPSQYIKYAIIIKGEKIFGLKIIPKIGRKSFLLRLVPKNSTD